MQNSTLKGFAYVLFSIFIWSGWIVASRYSALGTLSAYDITAIRFSVAGVLLLPIVLKRGLAIGPWGWRGAIVLALCMGAPYTNIAVAGMKYAPASHASTFINGALLILTTFVGIRYLHEPTSRARLFGVACSLAGIICILLAKNVSANPHQWLGHLMFILTGLMWGAYTLFVRAWKVDAFHAAGAVCVVSLIVYVPGYLVFAPPLFAHANIGEVLFQAFYQGVLTGVVAFISFNKGIALLGASRAGALIPLVPAISTLLAVPFLGEIPSTLEWIGVITVSLGVFLATGLLRSRADLLLQREVGD